ncbi:transmembrane protein 138 [Copidosoma floridanum]|uniref:transmembrane protein 138 n=1 Tax=Copidosoma floridanum TaxID=29053 RepID=UPI0006C976D3|nr:transmembrane protein 138 [Copidosoma floridanum]
MNLTQKKYSFTLILQYACLMFDVGANSFATFARSRPADLLVLFVIQDFCLITALTILLANFFSTYVFQAGLIQLLYTQFRMTLVICVAYIMLSIGLHSWHMTIHWTSPLSHFWPVSYYSLFITQRSFAVLYYYFSKRASLRISDPKFHEGSKWVQKQFSLT